MRKALLAAVAIVSICISVLFGQSVTSPRFELASIKPNTDSTNGVLTGTVNVLPGGRLSAKEALPRYIIQRAFSVRSDQISGGPDWINSAHYDIEAKGDGNANSQQVLLMLQALLEDRFKLKIRRETKQLPVYELTVGKDGPKLATPKEGSCVNSEPGSALIPPPPPGPNSGRTTNLPCGRVVAGAGTSENGVASARMDGRSINMTEFVKVLSNFMASTVIDKTGFTGTFDLNLRFLPDQAIGILRGPVQPGIDPNRAAASVDPNAVTIFTAVQEQLGLKLSSAKGPVEVIVIESVERPTPNTGGK